MKQIEFIHNKRIVAFDESDSIIHESLNKFGEMFETDKVPGNTGTSRDESDFPHERPGIALEKPVPARLLNIKIPVYITRQAFEYYPTDRCPGRTNRCHDRVRRRQTL
jgi:hypothetical protein